MKVIKIHNTIDNDAFLGSGEFGYITKKVEEINENPDEPIIISLNTPGGYVYDGYPILSAIDDHKAKVIAQVDGLSASMGAYIMAFADEVRARSFSDIMLHKAYNPYMEYVEDEDERSKIQARLDKMNKRMAQAFITRGADVELIQEIFLSDNKDDYWFTADEAKKYGLIDEVIGSDGHGDTIKLVAMKENRKNNIHAFWNNKPKFYKKNEEKMGLFDNKDEIVAKVTDFENALASLTDQLSELAKATESISEKVEQFNELNEKVDKVFARIEELANEDDEKEEATKKEIAELSENLQAHIDLTNEALASAENKAEEISKNVTEQLEGLKTNFVPDEGNTIEKTNPMDEAREINRKNDRRNR